MDVKAIFTSSQHVDRFHFGVADTLYFHVHWIDILCWSLLPSKLQCTDVHLELIDMMIRVLCNDLNKTFTDMFPV